MGVSELDNHLMIKVKWVEQLQADFGERKDKDNTVRISKVIMTQQLKNNFKMFKIRLLKVLKGLLCKKSLR